jgi:hypothetical protein
VKKNSFGLLELEMADLERFWRKTPLGPLGVKEVWCFVSASLNLQYTKWLYYEPFASLLDAQ